MRIYTWFSLIAMGSVGLLSACASCDNGKSQHVNTEHKQGAEHATITGSFAYRERIATPQDAIATVSLSDVSRMDVKAPVLASSRIALAGKNPPFSYTLSLPAEQLNAKHRYAVRAVIRDAAEQLLWTTDTTMLIDPTLKLQSLEPLRLVAVNRPTAESGGSETAEQLHGNWRIVQINGAAVLPQSEPSMNFAADGRLSGLASCNRYSGEYQASASGKLSVQPLAATKRACVPDLNEQESALLTVLQNANSYQLRRDRLLMISDGQGGQIVAQR